MFASIMLFFRAKTAFGWVSKIKGLVPMMKTPKFAVMSILTLIVAGALCFFVWDYNRMKKDNAEYRLQTDGLITLVEDIRNKVSEQTIKINDLNKRSNEIELVFNKNIESITDLRSQIRNSDVNSVQIEAQINTMFNDMNRRIVCLSGNTEQCE